MKKTTGDGVSFDNFLSQLCFVFLHVGFFEIYEMDATLSEKNKTKNKAICFLNILQKKKKKKTNKKFQNKKKQKMVIFTKKKV